MSSSAGADREEIMAAAISARSSDRQVNCVELHVAALPARLLEQSVRQATMRS
jgi:hypothetical protein